MKNYGKLSNFLLIVLACSLVLGVSVMGGTIYHAYAQVATATFTPAPPTATFTPAPATPTSSVPTCNGSPVTISYTGNEQSIEGTSGDDVIKVVGNDNVVIALSGDDSVCVQGDDNLVNANNGNDFISLSGNNNMGHGNGGTDTCVVAFGAGNSFKQCEN